MTTAAAVGRRMRAARALAGQPVAELAPAVGVSSRTLRALERGERLPNLIEAAAVAHVAGVPIEFLLPPPPPVEAREHTTEERAITGGQQRAWHAKLGALGALRGLPKAVVKRQTLAAVAEQFGRNVAGSGDLTEREASWALDLVERWIEEANDE